MMTCPNCQMPIKDGDEHMIMTDDYKLVCRVKVLCNNRKLLGTISLALLLLSVFKVEILWTTGR